MDKEQLAWAAGFFDGEGHIQIRGNKVSLILTQKERVALDFFKWIVQCGHIYRYERETPSGKATYYHVYQLNTHNVIPILYSLLPYLQVKGEEAKIALNILEKRNPKSFVVKSGMIGLKEPEPLKWW